MVLTGLLVGAALGFVLQRGRFCVTGAFRDAWITRGPQRTRWLLAYVIVIAVQSLGVAVLAQTGVIHLSAMPLPVVATGVGAFLFGFSMVLAGGCATGTWYRAGEGLIGSWVALATYAGSAAVMKYGPLASATKSARGSTLVGSTIPGAFGVSPWWFVAAICLGTTALVVRALRRPAPKLATLPPRHTGLRHLLFERRWHPFATALAVAAIAIVAWPLSTWSGRPDGLGITTPSANIVSWLTTGNASRIDWGVLLVVGILLGSFVAARGSGEFRLRVPEARTVVTSGVGGIGMGVGAALAGGCTIGNGLTQAAQFSWQGWVSLLFMILGTGLAAHLTIVRPRRRAAALAASAAGLEPATVPDRALVPSA